VDQITADVEQGSAAGVDLVADIRWVNIEVAEVAHDRAQRADASFIEKFANPQPLWVAADHESLADFDAGSCTEREQRFRLGDSQAKRLLAEHVFPGFCGFDRPRYVELVGKRIVDRVDLGIVEKLLV